MTERKTLRIDMCDRCIYSKTRTISYQESLSESSVAVQLQGGCVNAHAAFIAICQRALANAQALAIAIANSLQALAIAQALALAIAIANSLQAPAMCHCQKLSRAGVQTSSVPHASFLVSPPTLPQ